ncbi:hypothetical protein BN1012_Phect2736 [Candidatus Phaeomarinobacter ectocarpi]|uniref:Uncharacterized protein n=1 Tax=Candidatus Phaeomarinibacter ectocarpi TaxID=1458461 RepID=X5MH53_9HYPH|nr:hypothetical protein BN1012_Phect2736 [Candidatus Phaeomarinobacter ectocarpi]
MKSACKSTWLPDSPVSAHHVDVPMCETSNLQTLGTDTDLE